MFDETHGIHADGVGASTPVLPNGWRDRLIEIANSNTGGVRGLCLEPHDLVISKLVAGRRKGTEFCDAVLRSRLVVVDVLSARVGMTDLTGAIRRRILAQLKRWADG